MKSLMEGKSRWVYLSSISYYKVSNVGYTVFVILNNALLKKTPFHMSSASLIRETVFVIFLFTNSIPLTDMQL